MLVPIVVIRKENDRYEMLSGHRRKKVYEILGKEEMDAIIKNLNDYDATYIYGRFKYVQRKIIAK